MPFEGPNSGIIFTNTNCIGCNKCISGCPVPGANVVVKEADTERCTVQVDPRKCILCGTCINACVHEARTYHDDTDAFFQALARGERISLLVAPTLLTDYEKQYNNILGYLKECGANHIYNTGFGGDIMVWVYINFILEFGLNSVISQMCPVIVNYLEKYHNELLKCMVPVQSSMMCTAIYVSDYLGIDDKLAYISPCIASKHEITDVNTYDKVAYNVTFERLMKRIENVDLTKYYAEDEIAYGLGALTPTSGGLLENIKQYIGFNEVLTQTSGPINIFPYFNHYHRQLTVEYAELPFLVEVMSCTDGCNFGTGTNCGYGMRNEMAFSVHRSRERAFRSGIYTASGPKERLKKLNNRFKNLEMSSFVRQYGNTRQLTPVVIAPEDIELVFQSMYKTTPEKRHTDCGSCGYKTCLHMATAIASHLNYKENCINYAKERIRQETEKTNQLLQEISDINEELRKSTQLKSNFLANMSHEIRTPLNAIIGMAEMALRGDLPDEERGYLQQIKSSGRSLLAIINDILDFSKIESGKMELNETEYTVMSILNDTVNIVMTRIGDKDITLTIEADPTVPFKLLGDDIRIKQVLVNLANNAVKFTQTGFVEISLRHKRNRNDVMLEVAVRDSGIGIKPADQEKLFTSFQQVDSKRNRNIEGTGLGLAIAREFIGLMHGQIRVESVYGKGSTFSFSIPQKIVVDLPSVRLKDDAPRCVASLLGNEYIKEGFARAARQLGVENIVCAQLSDIDAAVKTGAKFVFVEYFLWSAHLDTFTKEHPQVQMVVVADPRKEAFSISGVRKMNKPVYCLNLAAALNREAEGLYDPSNTTHETRFEAPEARVLIVDDNAINLTVAEGLLSPLHMILDVATSAYEALEKIQDTQYDIIFMDHMMPDVDGVEATHMIRAIQGEYYKKLPIIALTANAINNAKEMFLREGMNDFVAKPIDMTDITTKLRRWLPPEKIREIGTELNKNATEGTIALPQIDTLDVRAGVALTGSVDIYKNILADYHDVIEKKSALIASFAEKGNLQAYTIEVHALKSASKLIGATELSVLAAELEQCGLSSDAKTIGEKTPELLQRYRAYLPVLAPYCKHMAAVQESVELPLDALAQKLTALYGALDDFDIDAAGALMDELRGCVLSDAENTLRERLSDTIAAMEYDDAAALAAQLRESVETRS